MYKKAGMKDNSDESMFLIADAISDGVYVIDREGTVTAINKIYSELSGIKEENILGKNMEDVWKNHYVPADSDVFVVLENESMPSYAEMIVKSGNGYDVDNPYPVSILTLKKKTKISVITTLQDTDKIVLMTGIPVFDEGGEIKKVYTIIRDLTDLYDMKKKLSEAENEKKRFINELKYHRKNELKTDLIGKSRQVAEIRETVYSIADADATVLITGETGVGKEIVARELYKNSNRKNNAYVKINCSAIPETLLESELFGYEKGAFTGAQNKEKLGLFEIADNGTLLLDEIGELPMHLQSKLLRVIQEKELRRVGGEKTRKIDVRIIAATNQDLKQLIKTGKFREDLYYRLNVIPLVIPPLRERKEDISVLVDFFADRFNKKHSKSKFIDRYAVDSMMEYDWPGNVRELENIIERLMIIGTGNIIMQSDIERILGKSTDRKKVDDSCSSTLRAAVDKLEKEMIAKALSIHGNTYGAARELGINQSTVVRKAKALGIEEW
ncbi:sigma-54 interaction domain-containing protein [Proteocatella sphenisci]|uniref:sigma-54 interaction domain-containing protein n=1 Tax=Proteocatella sphenisci TaxID=181070 RepID=UPI0004BA6D4C|nr:sigma 54-interacting transcriptional regulator [Proteocatella sphenisci]